MKSIVKDVNNRCSYVHTFEAVKSKAKKNSRLEEDIISHRRFKTD